MVLACSQGSPALCVLNVFRAGGHAHQVSTREPGNTPGTMHAMNIGDTAMIAGAAAVVAAALGAWGVVRAARHTSSTQRSSQHEHWRRQGRRDAYASFVSVASDYYAVAARASVLARVDGPRSQELQNLLDQAAELDGSLTKAAAVVEVEGPRDVAAAATMLTRLLQGGISESRYRHEPRPRLSGSQPPPPPGMTSMSPARASMREFRELARRALDDPSAALPPGA